MYKLIVDNIVVDVVKKLRYVRYIPELNKVVVTTPTSAQAVCGSDNKTFYALKGVEIPSKKSYWKQVTIVKISDNEYKELKTALELNTSVTSDYLLAQARSEKIKELSERCNQKIISGFTCVLSDSKEHHFRLTVEDQLNLLDIQRDLLLGAENIVFHATDEPCQIYTAEDIQTILTAAATHKKKETTYFNVLKSCINSMNNIEHVKSIRYGDTITSLPVEIQLDTFIKELL